MPRLRCVFPLFACGYIWLPHGEAQTTPTGDAPSLASLFEAADKNDLAKMKALIDAGALVNGTTTKGQYTYTPLTDVADAGKVEALKYLIDRGANQDLADNEGSTPLLHACWTNHTDCALALLDAGANPNLASKWGRSPLMYAAQKGNDVLVAALLAHHADVNATCSGGPAVWWAAGDRHFGTLKLLVEAGANLGLKASQIVGDSHRLQMSLLAFPASAGDIATMQLLLDHGFDVNDPASDGSTALTIAATTQKPEVVQWLLAKGARIDQQNDRGETPLIVAAMYRKLEVVQKLVECGAKLDIQDKRGRSALMWAAREAATDVGSLLLDRGANIDLQDPQGETALTLAGNMGKRDLVNLIKAKSPKRTDLHIICDAEPHPPLSPAKAWALGVCAIYTQADGLNHEILGGNPDDPDDSIRMLHDGWGISSRDSLLREINDLETRGHRDGYQRVGGRLAAMGFLTFHLDLLYVGLIDYWESRPDRTAQMVKMRNQYLKWGNRSGLAWDLCRAANLVNNAYAAKYIGEDEAWKLLMPIAQRTQSSFASWREMNENFLDAREIWARQRDSSFEACTQLLLNPSDLNSPWNYNAWKTDLSN